MNSTFSLLLEITSTQYFILLGYNDPVKGFNTALSLSYSGELLWEYPYNNLYYSEDFFTIIFF
jgi:hypothetical protein